MNVQKIILNPYLLAVLHGVCLTAIFVLFFGSRHEDHTYAEIEAYALSPGMNEEEEVLALLHTTNELLRPRLEVFGFGGETTMRERWLGSSDVQLNQPEKACGSFVHVLGRLLQVSGYEVRIAQLRCGTAWACHIVLEAKLSDGWVVLDPLYDIAYRKPDQSLASLSEVRTHWAFFKEQAPPNYKMRYDYDDVRYTNWSKIPVVMPLVRSALGVFMGPDAEVVSIRAYVLNVYKTYLVLMLGAYVLLILLTIQAVRVHARRESTSAPPKARRGSRERLPELVRLY